LAFDGRGSSHSLLCDDRDKSFDPGVATSTALLTSYIPTRLSARTMLKKATIDLDGVATRLFHSDKVRNA
jgi:hypothetical protein